MRRLLKSQKQSSEAVEDMMECLVMPGYIFEENGKLLKVKRAGKTEGSWTCGPAEGQPGSSRNLREMSTKAIIACNDVARSN